MSQYSTIRSENLEIVVENVKFIWRFKVEGNQATLINKSAK